MKTHNGIGRYVDIHKISALTDYQIMEFWSLRNKDSFFSVIQIASKVFLISGSEKYITNAMIPENLSGHPHLGQTMTSGK